MVSRVLHKFTRSIFFAVLWLSAAAANAEVFDDGVLSLEEVIESTIVHHPRIQVALSELEDARGGQLAATGEFDWQIEQDSLARTSGFYNGWIVDQKLSRRLPIANAKVSGGYRISDGIFPIYEDINNTLSGGEASVELSLSLLQNRETDSRRTALANTQIELDVARQDQRNIVNQLLLEAAVHYLDWFRSLQQVDIALELLKLATDRQEGIKVMVAQGEIAELSITEFETTLLSRQANLMASKQKLAQSAVKLSLFLRDRNGMPVPIPSATQAKEPDIRTLFALPSPQELRNAIYRHPELIAIQQQIAQTKNTIGLRQNQLLPQLDLTVKAANDIGTGSTTLNGFESYVGLRFSVPFEQRVAKGELQKERAKLLSLQAKQQELRDKLSAELEEILIALENLTLIRQVRVKQAEVAAKLVKQEQARFDAGDSDLFLLNSRETNSALAQLSAIDAGINILRQQIFALANAAVLETQRPSVRVK